MTQINQIQKKISDVNKKFFDASRLVKKADYNAVITEIEGKLSSITGLATTSVLTAVESRIPDVNNLVKKQVMMLKYYTLNLNILLKLITIDLQMKSLI